MTSSLSKAKDKDPALSPRGSNQRRKMKSVLCEGLINDLYETLANGVPITYACTNVGCSFEAVSTWSREADTGVSARGRKLKPEERELRLQLKQAVERGKAAFVNGHLANIKQHSKDDWKASAWSLSHAPETREQFSDAGRIRIEVEKRLAVAITVLQKELPPEMFERVLTSMSEATLEAA